MRTKRKSKLVPTLIVVVVIVCVGIYVGGYWGQRLVRYFKGFTEIYYMDLRVKSVIQFAFNNGVGLTLMILTDILLGYAALKTFTQMSRFQTAGKDDRNFEISTTGTYGTAQWLDDGTMRKAYSVGGVEDNKGTIFGTVQTPKSPIRDVILKPKEPELVCSRITARPDNQNMFIIGPPGRGKTRSHIMPHILQTIRRGESLVLTDPKGELYRDTAEYLRRNGYTVRVFNVADGSNMRHSDSWNPFSSFVDAEGKYDTEAVLSFVRTFIINTQGIGDAPFWGETAEQLLTALISYSMNENKSGTITFRDSSTNSADTGKEIHLGKANSLGTLYKNLVKTSPKDLKALFLDDSVIKDTSPTYSPARGYAQNPDNLLANIYTGLSQRLRHFTIPELRKMTETTEIDLTLPAKEKCAYFVILNDQQNTYQFLTAIFFNFFFRSLTKYADTQHRGRCTVPVNILMDEFANLGMIPGYNNLLTTARGRNIRITTVVQSMSQLEDLYPKTKIWETIFASNQYVLIMGGSFEVRQMKYLSDMLGTMTILTKGKKSKRLTLLPWQWVDEYQTSEGEGKRALMTPEELRKLPENELILMKTTLDPVKLDMYSFDRHPHSKYLVSKMVLLHYPEWQLDEMLERFQSGKVTANVDAAISYVKSLIEGDIIDIAELKKLEKLSAEKQANLYSHEKRLAENRIVLQNHEDARKRLLEEEYRTIPELYEALLRDKYDRIDSITIKRKELEAFKQKEDEPSKKKHKRSKASQSEEKDAAIIQEKYIENMREGMERENRFLNKRIAQLVQLVTISDKFCGSDMRKTFSAIDNKVRNERLSHRAAPTPPQSRSAVKPEEKPVKPAALPTPLKPKKPAEKRNIDTPPPITDTPEKKPPVVKATYSKFIEKKPIIVDVPIKDQIPVKPKEQKSEAVMGDSEKANMNNTNEKNKKHRVNIEDE